MKQGIPGSYEKINYSLRPAKAIERKMMGEAFRKLSAFGRIEDYRYIGFGSPYFSDFIYFHRSLNIRNMISIEHDVHNQERFEFNLPFKCVKLKFGESTEILQSITWDMRTIFWMDYDAPLTKNILSDIQLIIASALPGSVLIITVNAQPDKFDSMQPEELSTKRLLNLKERVGAEKVPMDIDGKNLREWGVAKVYSRIINNQIQETLSQRNGGREFEAQFCFQQLFNFNYADGARMLTVGGLLFDNGQENLLRQCGFENLQFIKTDEDPFLIQVPNLTYKEIRYLDSQLPVDALDNIDAKMLPETDLEKYERVYRYFPNFAETEF